MSPHGWITEVDKAGAGGAGLLEKRAYSTGAKNVARAAWARAKVARPVRDVATQFVWLNLIARG